MKVAKNGGEILIQNNEWPLIIEIHHPPSTIHHRSDWYLVDELNGREYALNESGTIEITDPVERLTLYRNTLTPEHFALHQNYPNPFNPSTTIAYDLPNSAYVEMVIYDVMGREVARLENTIKNPGSHQIVWNADGFSNGVYFYHLSARPTETSDQPAFTETRKLILLK